MDAGYEQALRALEEMRLQVAVDRLVARGLLPAGGAFGEPGSLERTLAERGLLGLDLEALRREARQQRLQAGAQAQLARRQRQAAAARRLRSVSRLDSVAQWGGTARSAAPGSGRRA